MGRGCKGVTPAGHVHVKCLSHFTEGHPGCGASLLSWAMLLLQEYEEKAVELGLDHTKRLGLRQRLKDVRLSCPLFDTTLWVRDLEKVYFKMWDIHCEGKGPHTFDV